MTSDPLANPRETSRERMFVAGATAALLVSVLCNLVFVWRNATLNHALTAAGGQSQQVEQSHLQLKLVAQELVRCRDAYPWLDPILARYGYTTSSNAVPAKPKP